MTKETYQSAGFFCFYLSFSLELIASVVRCHSVNAANVRRLLSVVRCYSANAANVRRLLSVNNLLLSFGCTRCD